MLDAIEKWLETESAPGRDGRSSMRMSIQSPLVEDMKELGLFGALSDPEYGGLGSPHRLIRRLSC